MPTAKQGLPLLGCDTVAWVTIPRVAVHPYSSAIRTQVLVNGKYSTTATIRSGLQPTSYAVMGTFQGKALDTVAWMTVR
jgi:hypothetical protein